MNPLRLFCVALLLAAVVAHAQPTGGSSFEFRDRGVRAFNVQASAKGLSAEQWLKASPAHAPEDVYWLGSRVAVQLRPEADVQKFLAGTKLKFSEALDDNVFILQASDALTAANEAHRFAKMPGVLISTPIMREPLGAQTIYAAAPNDPLFSSQWHLENRDGNGVSLGVDLNVRAGWLVTRGEGITVAIADSAVETTHPDLASRSADSLHYNFFSSTPDLLLSDLDKHATALAGLLVGEMNNGLGISGVAPGSKFASWRIFNTNGAVVDQVGLRNMFQYASNSVAVQNHSWAYTGTAQGGPSFVGLQGLETAILKGRKGKGVVMVRSAGNFRLNSAAGTLVILTNGYAGNANNDGYVNDPRVIAVAAASSDGRVSHYSSPGACILVAGLSSESSINDTGSIDSNFPTLTTTDRSGSLGYNTNDDYAFGLTGFTGTSGVAPEIAGLCAMILSANTNLTYRDVQQILILSSRHYDFGDSTVETNGAGFIVSHNLGFGIPDAKVAVKLAKGWINHPALTTVIRESFASNSIPDAGYLVRSSGANVPTNLLSVSGWMPWEERHPDLAPSESLRPDTDTAALPLVDVGQALTDIGLDLSNKGALIQRGGDSFYNKIHRAEMAGAKFAIVYNNAGDNLVRMTISNFVKIPSIFIGQTAGASLVNEVQTNANLRTQLGLDKASYSFVITNQMVCEHVGVRIEADTHARRGDLRITLISPNGTRSILQRYDNGFSTDTGPPDWTYWTTHNFFESTYGTWTVQFSDEQTNSFCSIISCRLIINGAKIVDKDHDGLDDKWEIAKFGSITAYSAKDDPDADGFSNIREQIAGTNPKMAELPFVTLHPLSRSTSLGSSTTFSAAGTGVKPFFYQWQFNGATITGATNSTYTITNVQFSQAGNYSFVVDNLTGSATSSNATLAFYLSNDVDGNHMPDLLVQNTNRFIQLWNMSLTNLLSAIPLNDDLPLSTNSRVAAQADFNSDGKLDLVIQSNGLISVWLMDGTNRTETVKLKRGVLTPAAWKVVGARDFNRDGYPDILLRHDAGFVNVWQMKGTNFLSAVALNGGLAVPPDLKLVVLDDFNHDGNVDILWQSTKTGALTIWYMNKFTRTKIVTLSNRGMLPSQGWTISGAVDLSGDGNRDLLWKQTNGTYQAWFMNGTNFIDANYLFNGTPVPEWNVVGER
ncbi:MAG: hypothetical protein JWM68_127 [Verrucomicrobiales bacterium]|nr:hypothetical protein [Verrucomicrobiales bacterium]